MKYYQQLFEALDLHQTATVDYWSKLHDGGAGKKISEHVMKGEDTIYLPLKSKEDHTGVIPSDIHSHLENHGFTIPSFHEYRAGYAVDKHGRMTSIGKALGRTKAAPELKQKFDNDPSRQTRSESLSVAITHNPHHVAGMSTDRGWTSCMHMYDGCNTNYLEKDIQHGTHTAYLIHKDDKNIENPIARLNLKPHNNETGHTILRPDKNIYGSGTDQFHNTVKEWSETHFPMKTGTYRPHDDIYEEAGNSYRNVNVEKEHGDIIHLASPSLHNGESSFSNPDRFEKLKNKMHYLGVEHQHSLIDKVDSTDMSDEDRTEIKSAIVHHSNSPEVVNHAMEGLDKATKHKLITGKFTQNGSQFSTNYIWNPISVAEHHKNDALDHAISTGNTMRVYPHTDALAKRIISHTDVNDYLANVSVGKESPELASQLVRQPNINPASMYYLSHKIDADSLHHIIGKVHPYNDLTRNPNFNQSHADAVAKHRENNFSKYAHPNVKNEDVSDETLHSYPGLARYYLNSAKDKNLIHRAIDHIDQHGTPPIYDIHSVAELSRTDKKAQDFLIHSPHIDQAYIPREHKNRLNLAALHSPTLNQTDKMSRLKDLMQDEVPRSYQFAALDATKGTGLEEPAKNGFDKLKRSWERK